MTKYNVYKNEIDIIDDSTEVFDKATMQIKYRVKSTELKQDDIGRRYECKHNKVHIYNESSQKLVIDIDFPIQDYHLKLKHNCELIKLSDSKLTIRSLKSPSLNTYTLMPLKSNDWSLYSQHSFVFQLQRHPDPVLLLITMNGEFKEFKRPKWLQWLQEPNIIPCGENNWFLISHEVVEQGRKQLKMFMVRKEQMERDELEMGGVVRFDGKVRF